MRKALELSIISVPCLVIVSANSFEVEPPADTSAMSTPQKSSLWASSRTVSSFGPRQRGICVRAPLRTEKQQFVDGQTALFQNVHKFLANGSAGPDNG